MKENEAPEKLYITLSELTEDGRTFVLDHHIDYPICTEYVRTDAFVEKARKWFEKHPEQYDANGVRVYGEKDFEDFVNYMKGE